MVINWPDTPRRQNRKGTTKVTVCARTQGGRWVDVVCSEEVPPQGLILAGRMESGSALIVSEGVDGNGIFYDVLIIVGNV